MQEDIPRKLKVGIIMGGVSSEKEVSLESGRNIFSKIDRKKYDPLPIFFPSSWTARQPSGKYRLSC